MIDKELLEILACPACRSSVEWRGDTIVCTGASCGLVFPVRDGIPVLLVEEGRKPEKKQPTGIS
ncbi:MAG: Trm112 family protein [Candidatus Omnitrophica bacterium]|nr:Trm112 family protein [Candidatus Omnitrophota bacterium]